MADTGEVNTGGARPVGFVGVGNMGGRMTRRLTAPAHAVPAVGPNSTVKLQHDLAARGVQFLDAGISGGAAAADKGTLTLMVGGDKEALAKVAPYLDAFSAHVHHMGASGSGHVTKVLNNFLNGVT